MSIKRKDTKAAGMLIVGYGNPLRSDDGVGQKVAEAVEEMHLPGVQTLVCQQLSPEHAQPISKVGRVVFVDAAVDASKEVRLRKLGAGDSSQLMAHAADPRTMLALARDVFGHCPEAWCLTIPAAKLDFGHDLSSTAQQGFEKAVQEIKKLCGS